MKRTLTLEEATAIQTAINARSNARLIVDGHFGTLSQQALMRFQAEQNISPADGNPTQPTLDALGIPDLFTPQPKETTMNNANVAVTSSWLSTKNWAAVVGILSVILPLFGVHLPVGWGDTAYQVIAALSGAYILVKNTWFTTTITTASAKKL